jgi:phage gpG-like protein
MAGATVVVTDNASPMLKLALARLKDFRTPLTLAGGYMFRATQQQFDSEGARSGDKWEPLSPRTIKSRRKGKGIGGVKILQDTGRLKSSVTHRTGGSIYDLQPSMLTMGTNLVYAAIHQHGGDITRKPHIGTALHKRQKNGQWRFARATKKTKLGPNLRLLAFNVGESAVHIPARPFLVVTDTDRRNITTIFRDYALRSFGKR